MHGAIDNKTTMNSLIVAVHRTREFSPIDYDKIIAVAVYSAKVAPFFLKKTEQLAAELAY